MIAQTSCHGFGDWEVTMNQKNRREFESLAEAAERTGLSTKTIRRRIASGVLAAYRSGPRVLRVDPYDVDQMMVRLPTMSAGPESMRAPHASR
ncbi:helix-turn-helix domain-containing protein [Humibacillus xanthopallidus]|nr:helix-turn-helix domain-containing protein [Humibacillus xanthopallidus]